jgi:thiol-disulfide isomerase/thioredoxin
MKKIIKVTCLMLLSFVFISKVSAQEGFTVTVKIPNPNHYRIMLTYEADKGLKPVKQYTMEDGYMVFRGSVDIVTMAHLLVMGPNAMVSTSEGGVIPGPGLPFVLRNGATIVIEGNAGKPYLATVKSTDKETMAYETFYAKDKVLIDKDWTLVKEMAPLADGTPAKEKIEAERKALKAERQAGAKKFVKQYSGTYGAIQAFSSYALDLGDNVMAKQYAMLPPTYKNTEMGQVIQKHVDDATATSVGKPVVLFSQKGYNDSVVDIASLKGKVVLIDFWGSWCGACRAGFPYLKQMYTKYKDKGFEIVGVGQENGSKDDQLKAWTGAIKDDGINWLNILNDPDQTDIVKIYGATVFPTRILIDRNGVIRGRFTGVGDAAFKEKLKAMLEEPAK